VIVAGQHDLQDLELVHLIFLQCSFMDLMRKKNCLLFHLPVDFSILNILVINMK